MVEDDGSAVVVVPVVIAACYLLAPVVRWLGSLRRRQGTTPWPDGAQGYAVLAVLARVQSMHPDRLATLTGLPRCGATSGWRPARREGSRFPPRGGAASCAERADHRGGLGRLDAWTVELTARAARAQPCTDSTAPTSPDVSSARSASDVT